ncbi:MAG: hypothetical protein AB7S54_09330 [Bacteroidales bacterium]
MTKTNKKAKPPFCGYFQIIGRACGCSPQYASMVINGRLGKYQNRNSGLVKKIRAKAKEIDAILLQSCTPEHGTTKEE